MYLDTNSRNTKGRIMAQIFGAAMGSPMAIVDTVGRLWTNSVLDEIRVRGSGIVTFPKQDDRIINGNTFQAGSSTTGMPIDGSGIIFLVNGSNNLHFEYNSTTDGNCKFELYENVTVTDSGVSMPIFNLNRHAAVLGSTLDATLWTDPTVVSSGLMIHNALFLGGSGTDTKFVSAPLSASPLGGDWILEAGSCYMMLYKNICGRLLNIDFNALMHEHGH